MQTEIVLPNISNFVKSLRDIGYSFEIAVADILDNSISANANKVIICTKQTPDTIFCLLDNGIGMTESELIEAMRLSSKNPDDIRGEKDLGKFGLGLKTASFSQCKKLTVLSKRDNIVSIKQWDLDYISKNNEWLLITPKKNELQGVDLIDEFNQLESGTLVVWQEIDGISSDGFVNEIHRTKQHLALVFHRFLEDEFNPLSVSVNNDRLRAFNPFNSEHIATQEKSPEKIKIDSSEIKITPYILPRDTKVSQKEWKKYETREGYIKSQGFYLYRAKRLLIYGTWWGMHKITDAHKLVRIKIDIPNDQDKYWNIDVKKSKAQPRANIKSRLKIIIDTSTELGSRLYTGRGKKTEDKTTTTFWQTIPDKDVFRFGLNKEHPLYQKIKEQNADFDLLNIYLKGLEAYLPLEEIQSHLHKIPCKVSQKAALSEHDIDVLVSKLKEQGLEEDYIDRLLKTEIFKDKKELLRCVAMDK